MKRGVFALKKQLVFLVGTAAISCGKKNAEKVEGTTAVDFKPMASGACG